MHVWPLLASPRVAMYIMSRSPAASLFTHPELQMGAPYVEEVLDIVSDVFYSNSDQTLFSVMKRVFTNDVPLLLLLFKDMMIT